MRFRPLLAICVFLGACEGAPPPAPRETSAVAAAPSALATGQARIGAPRAAAAAPVASYAPAGDTYPSASANPVVATAEQPVSTFSLDVDTASYANVRRFLREGRLPPADAVRIEELVNYFDYAYALPETREAPFRPTVAVYPSPWRQGAEILHIGVKAFDVPAAARPKVNLVFLVDVSGSMAPEDRLPLLRRAFRLLVDGLGPNDRVSIVTYANDARVALPPTPGSEKPLIRSALDALRAGGGTAGGAGIQLAYEAAEANYDASAVNRVILATDGDFNLGIRDPRVLADYVRDKRRRGIYLSVLGVGRGNYRDATMQRLAQTGNGTAAYIDSFDEARKVLSREAAAALLPVADDVKVQVEFNPARIREWRLVGYETRQLRREDFSNDKVDAGDVGAGKAVTALYEIVREGSSAAFMEPLRYAARPEPTGAGEDAFLRIRYKVPGEESSRLIERAVSDADRVASVEALPPDLRFAAAVAGFGQILRDEARLGRFSLRDVQSLAQSGVGADPFGDRQEFLRLVASAAALKGEARLGAER